MIPVDDRRTTLEALRDELARRIPNAEDKDAASLTLRLQSVLAELDALGAGAKGADRGDALAARRAAREARKASSG